MRSTCPSCLSQVTHEDALPQVTCECGHVFSPFMDAPAETEEKAPEAPGGFEESQEAFKDIVQFGESLGTDEAPATPTAAAKPTVAPPKELRAPVVTAPILDALPISSDGSLSGYQIEEYLPPVSQWAPLEGDDPLQNGVKALCARASGQGATALLGFRWALSSDGTQALFSAIPIRCVKNA